MRKFLLHQLEEEGSKVKRDAREKLLSKQIERFVSNSTLNNFQSLQDFKKSLAYFQNANITVFIDPELHKHMFSSIIFSKAIFSNYTFVLCSISFYH